MLSASSRLRGKRGKRAVLRLVGQAPFSFDCRAVATYEVLIAVARVELHDAALLRVRGEDLHQSPPGSTVAAATDETADMHEVIFCIAALHGVPVGRHRPCCSR